MLRTDKCNECLYCERDVQIDMGCTLDVCNIVEKNIGIYNGLMCQDWKAKRNNEKVLDNCPFFKKRPNNKRILKGANKAKLINWFKENNKK